MDLGGEKQGYNVEEEEFQNHRALKHTCNVDTHDGAMLWYNLGRPVVTSQKGNWSVFV